MNDLELLKREPSTLRRRFGSAAFFAVLLTIVCGFVFMAIPAVMIRVWWIFPVAIGGGAVAGFITARFTAGDIWDLLSGL